MLRSVLVGALFIGCFCTPVRAAQDQIAVVIPIIAASSRAIPSAEATTMTYLVAQSVRWNFRQNDPNVQRSVAVLVPPLSGEVDLASAMQISRINGAQLALVMKAFRQSDGAKIHGVLAIPPKYADFRTQQLERLSLDYNGATLNLDVPSRFIVLPDFYMSRDDIRIFGDRKYLELCPVTPSTPCASTNPLDTTKSCRILGDEGVSFFETRRLTELGRVLMLTEKDQCYRQRHPSKAVVQQPVINFVAGVERYFAGDWSSVIDLMSSVTKSKALNQSKIAVQANLYMVRASLRQNQLAQAEKYTEDAEKINPKDTSVVETRVFLDLSNLLNAVNEKSPEAEIKLVHLQKLVQSQPSFVRGNYAELMSAVASGIRNEDH